MPLGDAVGDFLPEFVAELLLLLGNAPPFRPAEECQGGLVAGFIGLQSAIKDNPFYGGLWGYAAEAVGLSWAANLFNRRR